MTYIQPLFPLALLAAFLLALRLRRHRRGILAILALVLLFLIAWPPVAHSTMRLFERNFPPLKNEAPDTQAIVVLASEVCPPSPEFPRARPGSDTYERCQYAAWLYRARPLPVLASGGPGNLGIGAYSAVMRDTLLHLGVPEANIWCETRSHSTHENALYSSQMLREKGIRRIVLITDAYHMLRASACFRKEGMEVSPGPCGFRTYEGFHWQQLLPGWEPISWNEDALHESVGLLWYRAHGWI